MKIVKYLLAAILVISITKKVHVAPNALKNCPVNYNATTKTAHMNKTYVGVVEYKQAVTPPNQRIPALKLFATIPTPGYKPSKNYGAVRPTTSLYGLEVTDPKLNVKIENKTIGFYWPKNRIVQLNDGQTFVCIKEEIQRNYKKDFELGPIWTRFDAIDTKELSDLYKISITDSEFKNLVKNIGTIHKGNQIIKLYGVQLYQTSMPEITK